MRLIVLTMDYPRPDGTHERMFVHVRNKYYMESGLDIVVLNFACDYDYEIDGIKVITLKTYEREKKKYDIAVSHASNLRNHYVFLKKYESNFKKIVFFFHGHEVLKLNEVYPKPYPYMKSSGFLRQKAQSLYDCLKLFLWRNYYKQLCYKSEFVFVSNWIFEQFKKNTCLTENDLSGKCHIINNSIGSVFEDVHYDWLKPKEYDFITIRSNLDGAKYGVDLVVKLAEKNPKLKFLLIGRGKYFVYNKKPANLVWIDKTLDHSKMIDYLNKSKCGILLTREDTQGVMTCEFAAFGMPVITSDIEVCHEFFDIMPNVALVNNEDENISLEKIRQNLLNKAPYPKDKTYFAENTISKEIGLFNKIINWDDVRI